MAKIQWDQHFDRQFDERNMREWRCSKCRKLLAMEYIHSGPIAIKCRCGELNRLLFQTLSGNAKITTATPAGSTNNKLKRSK